MKKLSRSPEAQPVPPPNLPAVPGGWRLRTLDLPGLPQPLSICQPAAPDELLDSPEVARRHDRDGYMPYWAAEWAATLPTARFLAGRTWLPQARGLELGAGTGIAGLAAAAAGLAVTITDHDETAIAAVAASAAESGVSDRVAARTLDWHDLPEGRRYDFVFGADILYEARNLAPIVAAVDRLLAEGGTAFVGDPGRLFVVEFAGVAAAAGFRVRQLDEAGRQLTTAELGEPMTFRIVELTR